MSTPVPPGGPPPHDPYRPPPGGPNPYGPPPGGPNPYGPNPYAPQSRSGPPASKALAGWALGLALFFLVPFLTAIIGIVLAVVVLVRARDGRDHGSGLAIAALVVGPLVVLLWLGFFVLAGLGTLGQDDETRRDEAGQVLEGGEVSTIRLQVGDCFDDPALVGSDVPEGTETASVAVVPCDEPHQLEVYSDSELPEGEYPGESEVSELALERCLAEFRGFVGRGYARSELEVYTYYPLERSWDALDDRTLTCMIGDPAGPVTGSLRDAGR